MSNRFLLAPNPGTGLLHDQHEALAIAQNWIYGMGQCGVLPVVKDHQVEIAFVGGFLERLLCMDGLKSEQAAPRPGGCLFVVN